MRIQVTQQDIDEALKEKRIRSLGYQTGAQCPVARAASRAFGFKIWATSGELRKYYEEIKDFSYSKGFIADLPIDAQLFIAEFDSDEPVQPIEFEVQS